VNTTLSIALKSAALGPQILDKAKKQSIVAYIAKASVMKNSKFYDIDT
jgi:hypothetical protein